MSRIVALSDYNNQSNIGNDLMSIPVEDITVPTGTIMMYMFNTAPEGWGLCDGNPIPSSNKKLIDMIGSVYPDLRGLTVIGNMSLGDSSLTPELQQYYAGLGQTKSVIGEDEYILKYNQLPSHNHSIPLTGTWSTYHSDGNRIFYPAGTHVNGWYVGYNDNIITTERVPIIDTTEKTFITLKRQLGNQGGTEPINNIQPSYVINYIIKH